jgi:hypothetical protein
MRAVLPGKPRPTLACVCTGYWDDRRLIVSSGRFAVHVEQDILTKSLFL